MGTRRQNSEGKWVLGPVRPQAHNTEEMKRFFRRAHIDSDGVNRLRALMSLMEGLPELIETAVILARSQGYTWEQIGEVFGGSTKQSMHQRFAYLDDSVKPEKRR